MRISQNGDQPNHLIKTANWLQTGWYAVPASGQVPGAPSEESRAPWTYGPAFSLSAHAANLLLGNESPRGISEDQDSQLVRQWTSAAVGLLTVAAVAATALLLTGSRLMALWTAAALVALPAWTGQSFNNLKDLPVAAGYSLITLGLVWLGVTGIDDDRRRPRVLSAAAIALGVLWSMGVRYAMWVPLGVSLIVFIAVVALYQRNARNTLRVVWPAVAGFTLGTTAVLALAFRSLSSIGAFFARSVSTTAEFGTPGTTLTAGVRASETDFPWWYLPAWLGASIPVLIGAAALAGIGLVIIRSVRVLRRGAPYLAAADPPVSTAPLGLLVVTQLVVVPLGIVVLGTVISGGIRHVLFVVPAIAVLGGYAAHTGWRTVRHRSGHVAPWVLAISLSVAIALPVIDQVRLFPYNASYVNIPAALGGVDGQWQTRWRDAGIEAIESIPVDAELWVSRLREPFATRELRRIAPYLPRQGAQAAGEMAGPGEYWQITGTNPGPTDGCQQVAAVTRPLRWDQMTVARVLRCNDPPGSSEPG